MADPLASQIPQEIAVKTQLNSAPPTKSNSLTDRLHAMRPERFLGAIARRGIDATATRTQRHSNISGEDRTAIELFIAGVVDWDTELRQFLDTSTDGKLPR